MVKKTIAQSKYTDGVKALKADDVALAVAFFEGCIKYGGYKDVREKLAQLRPLYEEEQAAQQRQRTEDAYQKAVSEMSSSFTYARIYFEHVPSDYKDTAKHLATINTYAHLLGLYVDDSDWLVTTDVLAEGAKVRLGMTVNTYNGSAARGWPASIELKPVGGRTFKFGSSGFSGTIDDKTMVVRVGGKTYTLRRYD